MHVAALIANFKVLSQCSPNIGTLFERLQAPDLMCLTCIGCNFGFTTDSSSVSEPRHVVCEFALQQLLRLSQFLGSSLLRDLFPSRVLKTTPRRHEKRQTKSRAGDVSTQLSGRPGDLRNDTNQQTVSLDVARSVAADVDVGCNNATTVASHDLSTSQYIC